MLKQLKTVKKLWLNLENWRSVWALSDAVCRRQRPDHRVKHHGYFLLMTILTSMTCPTAAGTGTAIWSRNNNLQSSDMQKSVWLVAVDNMPSLWRLAMRAPLRFGPVLDDKPVARRELLEHIEASAYYRWHYKQLPRLVASVQEELWEQIQLIHPVIRRENPQTGLGLTWRHCPDPTGRNKEALMPLEKDQWKRLWTNHKKPEHPEEQLIIT